MKPDHELMIQRAQRFQTDKQIRAIVKNARSRCACFWLDVANVSESGVGIYYMGRGFVPFSVKDELHLTLDTSAVIFRRPIHITATVKWREDQNTELGDAVIPVMFLGCQITSVDPIHLKAWKDGIQNLALREGQGILERPSLLVANG